MDTFKVHFHSVMRIEVKGTMVTTGVKARSNKRQSHFNYVSELEGYGNFIL